jgi:hypothetical protein
MRRRRGYVAARLRCAQRAKCPDIALPQFGDLYGYEDRHLCTD